MSRSPPNILRAATDNLMDWASRSEWDELRDEVMAVHTSLVLDEYEIESQEELMETIGEEYYFTTVVPCAFEDLVTQADEETGLTIVDDYLKRRGFKESVPGRRYLEAMRDSVMSLYEVVDSVPDSHLVLRDLLRGGEPVRVEERKGSQQLVKWDRLACRVVPFNRHMVITGANLLLTAETADHIKNTFADTLDEAAKHAAKTQGKDITEEGKAAVKDVFLSQLAPLFTLAWLRQSLDKLAAPPPQLRNYDGEELVFLELRWPFIGDAAAEIARRLDQDKPLLLRYAEDGLEWTWQSDASLSVGPRRDGLVYEAEAQGVGDDDKISLGTIVLEDGAIVLRVNSEGRAARGQSMMESRLAGLIGPAQIERQSLDELREKHRDDPQPASDAASSISPEEKMQILGSFKERHYRVWPDQALPALGGKTARQMARTKRGKAKVIALLKSMENHELRQARADSVPAYDFAWLWQELGLGAERDRAA
ncbi:MAG: hypothetical protein HY246_19985 [Proteobacteria bacterium]|nr:hypothetical protein [Pseudomonadota bacterium]